MKQTAFERKDLSALLENLPSELQSRKQWVAWKLQASTFERATIARSLLSIIAKRLYKNALVTLCCYGLVNESFVEQQFKKLNLKSL